MPTYEYRCPDGHEFEHFYRTISAAEAERPCPVCGKVATRKVSGGAALLFKGSGFYITDYGKDGKKNDPRSPGSSGSSSGKSEASAGGTSGDKKDSASTSSESKKESKKPDSSE